MHLPDAAVRRAFAPLLACVLVLTLAGFGRAQVLDPVWISTDGSQAGTPASVSLDAAASTPQQSVIDLVVHGYWLLPRYGEDGRAYQQVSVPGLPTTMEFGKPELPALRLALGIVTGANAINFAGAQVLAQSVRQGVLPWPHVIGAIPDTMPRPERFIRDDVAYSELSDYPGGYAGTFDGVDPGSGGMPAGEVELHPMRWNASGTLTVDDHVRYTFDHPGPVAPVELGSSQTVKAALGGLANAGVLTPYVSWDHVHFKGYFLFVVPAAYVSALTPLIEQKKKRGYDVTVIHTDDIPFAGPDEPECAPTRAAIKAWYDGTPRVAQHFCILAANHVQIPTCFSPRPNGYELGNRLATDDFFGDVDGNSVDDEGMEIFVGRIPINSYDEMVTAVGRILAYEDAPSYLEEFDHAALIAWNSNDDDRFLTAMNKVIAQPYASVLPTFEVIDGGLPYVNNTWVDGAAQTDGIVAYDGHGSPTEWWSWNRSAQSYSNSSIDALVNHPVLPLIWSFACYTGRVNFAECLGKHWLTHPDDGAAGFYGATEVSWIWDNGIMARRLFDAVFNLGITTLGIAIALEEFGTVLETSADNPVQYLLIGDPEMQVRRSDVAPPPYTVQVPPFLVAGPVPPIDISVRQADGSPAPGVRVALWKRAVATAAASRGARAAAADEVLDNRYSDAQGVAHFDLPALTAGTLYVTSLDDDAHVLADSIPVNASASVGTGAEAGHFRVATSLASGRVHFLLPAGLAAGGRVRILDVTGRAVATLAVTPGARALEWDGSAASGARARAGVYLARLESPGLRPMVVRVLRLE